MVALTHWTCVLFFLRDCGGLIVRVVSRLARQADVTLIPKGPPSSSVANYRPISVTLVMSEVFERLVSVRLLRFMERSGVLPNTQFALKRSGYLRCTFVRVPYTAKCIGEWEGR